MHDVRREPLEQRLERSGMTRPGPGSVTWMVNREIVVVAGWGRAVLLQLAHPSIAAGVHDHSGFRDGLAAAVMRLRSTVGGMLGFTFADDEAMNVIAARIHAIHNRVNGQVEQKTYSAHDPRLQRWVHATLVQSILLAFHRLVRPLSEQEQNRYCAEAAIMEPLMAMPDGWLSRDVAGLDAYVEHMLGSDEIRVTATARRLAESVLSPPWRHAAWPLLRPVRLLTIGSLPPAIRQAYGFSWRASDERALTRWTTMLRASRRCLPAAAREWPMARRALRGGRDL